MVRETTDFKKNNKIGLRNFREASDFHDLVKTQIVRMLRREHPDNYKVPIYTEHDPEKPNFDYPDIWMKTKSGIIVYELQSKITKSWTEQIQDKYETVDLIIVPLLEIENKWKNHKEFEVDPINSLRIVLSDYIV